MQQYAGGRIRWARPNPTILKLLVAEIKHPGVGEVTCENYPRRGRTLSGAGRLYKQTSNVCAGFRERNDCGLIELPYPDADGESANAIQT